MKKKFFILFCSSLLVLAACKKNNTSPGTPWRVDYVYDDSSHITSGYYYSAAGLLSGYYNDSSQITYAYHYPTSQTAEQIYLPGGSNYIVLYFWNSKSLVDSSTTLGASENETIEKKYTYNNNNFLTNVNWYNYQNKLVLTENFTITNNNITGHTYNVIDNSNPGLPSGSWSYTYYTGLANSLGNDYYGQVYFGASSKNAISSSTYTNGSASKTVNYRYNYNQGNISSELIYADSSGLNGAMIDSVSFGYTYIVP